MGGSSYVDPKEKQIIQPDDVGEIPLSIITDPKEDQEKTEPSGKQTDPASAV